MQTQENEIPSLSNIIDLYAKDASEKTVSNLKTTLKKYVLHFFKFRGHSQMKLKDYPSKILISDFVNNAQQYFEIAAKTALESGKNERTLDNNRSSLNRFLDWIQAQPWYFEFVKCQGIPKRAPNLRAKLNLDDLCKGNRNYGAVPYSLKEHELTPKLEKQIQALHMYLTSEYMPARKGDPPVRDTTWQNYKEYILSFLGWLKNVQEMNLDDLDITLLANKETLQEYLAWQFTARGNGFHHASCICRTAMCIAKWHYGKNSKRAKFVDCDAVLDIRAIQNELAPRIKTDRRTTSPEAFSKKLLDLEQCQEVVEYLRHCCSEKWSDHKKRSLQSVLTSWQNYLIIAILTYTPVRQREIRELQIDKNLRREPDGWWVTLTPDGHKTGAKTGKGREYPLFAGPAKEQLTRDMDEYIKKWRPKAQLNHDYLFFLRSRNYPDRRGMPIPDAQHLTKAVPRVMFRATAILYGKENAKHPSPHDFRRIFDTWLYTYGTPEEQDLYAELMGHSVEEARRTYAMVRSRDKTQRADEAFNAVAERAKRVKAQREQYKI